MSAIQIQSINAATGETVVRNATPDEIAEIEAQRNAPSPVPRRVTRRQARLALLNAGLLDAVEAAIAKAPPAVRITYEDATEWWRDDPLIASFSVSLGLTTEQVDNLFLEASQL
jgi:hypothetical protein